MRHVPAGLVCAPPAPPTTTQTECGRCPPVGTSSDFQSPRVGLHCYWMWFSKTTLPAEFAPRRQPSRFQRISQAHTWARAPFLSDAWPAGSVRLEIFVSAHKCQSEVSPAKPSHRRKDGQAARDRPPGQPPRSLGGAFRPPPPLSVSHPAELPSWWLRGTL